MHCDISNFVTDFYTISNYLKLFGLFLNFGSVFVLWASKLGSDGVSRGFAKALSASKIRGKNLSLFVAVGGNEEAGSFVLQIKQTFSLDHLFFH